MMEKTAPNKVPSGIEPVDKLLGGLESARLYFVHGEAAGKSLFGIKFLIEGLKRGENGALAVRYSPEDAVRRFARLGYDCLDDVYSGRLVILEYSDDIIQQISRLRELTPVLRELEWLLGETSPQRLVFDPVTSLVASDEGNLGPRAKEFADWARSFGATGVLVANGESREIVESFSPLVEEVFRFEVREVADHATRFLVFEKSDTIADQPIEVDPSRGVFLLGRPQVREQSPPRHQSFFKTDAHARTGQAAELDSLTAELDAVSEGPLVEPDISEMIESLADLEIIGEPGAGLLAINESGFEIVGDLTEADTSAEPEIVRQLDTTPLDPNIAAHAGFIASQPGAQTGREIVSDDASDDSGLSELIEELSNAASPLDLDIPELEAAEASAEETLATETPAVAPRENIRQPANEETLALETQDDSHGAVGEGPGTSQPQETELEPSRQSEETPLQTAAPSVEDEAPQSRRRSRASDKKIDSTIAARAVELLLRPPESFAETILPSQTLPQASEKRQPSHAAATQGATINAKDFSVLIIDDDPASCEQAAQALGEYTVEAVHDGVSGLAKLISFRPDLVILDVDLPVVDGFKVLAHIRSSLNMPIIIVSGTRVRASDRVLSAELGADYFMTKPLGLKELQQKARQLIARYRGINSWILTGPAAGARPTPDQDVAARPARIVEPLIMSVESGGDQFTPYNDFTAEVERRVRVAIDDGEPFSIVGCRLPQMTSNGGGMALRLYEMISTLARDTDFISTNPRNDLVILLADADSAGAKAFINRLRERVSVETDQEPSVWLRSFPELEEATEAVALPQQSGNGSRGRRASDSAYEPTGRIQDSVAQGAAYARRGFSEGELES